MNPHRDQVVELRDPAGTSHLYVPKVQSDAIRAECTAARELATKLYEALPVSMPPIQNCPCKACTRGRRIDAARAEYEQAKKEWGT